MEITGKVAQLGTRMEGQGARGPWVKQELIIETEEQYPKKVCLICWGDRVAEANNFIIGQTIKASVNIESREFNGKWYTDIRPWRFEVIGAQQQANSQPHYDPMAATDVPLPTDLSISDESDDLPF
ncbi:MAG: DUF3127 domain-containing protein [Lentimicrobiaceae bacterium]|jgi:hypothetical protein|nr:DUF3127 domain-containing protein [Lentimicrobiaceae bacterium]